ncbi:MAG: hypothetical protein H6502_04805 [Candidatus Woesearchaeota archaeon]|nr:MAG: hypothetical protein H6502_04805 [Candidatus Woesearchaeota archaeon]
MKGLLAKLFPADQVFGAEEQELFVSANSIGMSMLDRIIRDYKRLMEQVNKTGLAQNPQGEVTLLDTTRLQGGLQGLLTLAATIRGSPRDVYALALHEFNETINEPDISVRLHLYDAARTLLESLPSQERHHERLLLATLVHESHLNDQLMLASATIPEDLDRRAVLLASRMVMYSQLDATEHRYIGQAFVFHAQRSTAMHYAERCEFFAWGITHIESSLVMKGSANTLYILGSALADFSEVVFESEKRDALREQAREVLWRSYELEKKQEVLDTIEKLDDE